jgi:hypothetical protein
MGASAGVRLYLSVHRRNERATKQSSQTSYVNAVFRTVGRHSAGTSDVYTQDSIPIGSRTQRLRSTEFYPHLSLWVTPGFESGLAQARIKS